MTTPDDLSTPETLERAMELISKSTGFMLIATSTAEEPQVLMSRLSLDDVITLFTAAWFDQGEDGRYVINGVAEFSCIMESITPGSDQT